jgi:hypothetical protein
MYTDDQTNWTIIPYSLALKKVVYAFVIVPGKSASGGQPGTIVNAGDTFTFALVGEN